MTGELDREHVTAIGRELVRAAGVGSPTHPKLVDDIERAAWVALNSPTFRVAIADLCARGFGVRKGDQVPR